MENQTQVAEELEFDDVEFTASSSQDWTTVPEDDYILKLVGYKIVDKPQHRIEYEAKQNKKELAQIDPQQWEWTWEVNDGEFKGERLKEWTSRSWHEMSAGGQRAAALAGLEKYERQAMIDKGYPTMRGLMHKCLKAFVTETENKDGKYRNYIKNPRRLSTGRSRSQARATSDDTPAVPFRKLPDDIFENADTD